MLWGLVGGAVNKVWGGIKCVSLTVSESVIWLVSTVWGGVGQVFTMIINFIIYVSYPFRSIMGHVLLWGIHWLVCAKSVGCSHSYFVDVMGLGRWSSQQSLGWHKVCFTHSQ
eukprot:GHVN01021073.1.p1 GENE.GHVN01021073.1~~GHVN01021073.1.p1  ORF type:complete len:112 (+),score=18.91 GHVN01021073.1:135-470(+)